MKDNNWIYKSIFVNKMLIVFNTLFYKIFIKKQRQEILNEK